MKQNEKKRKKNEIKLRESVLAPNEMIHNPKAVQRFIQKWCIMNEDPTGSYQRLDLFYKVIRILCLNLTDVSYLQQRKRIGWKLTPVPQQQSCNTLRERKYLSRASIIHFINPRTVWKLQDNHLLIIQKNSKKKKKEKIIKKISN